MEAIIKNEVLRNADYYREKIINELPVKEHKIQVGDIHTTYLDGGEGTPFVLLHGPGESSIWWMRVIPHLVKKYNVIIPDLPGHGSSGSAKEKLTKEIVLDWLDGFLIKTCSRAPVLVGHVVGGAIAANYAIQPSKKVEQLVLVDSLGLSSFRPTPRFAYQFLRFMINPSEKSYLRFLPECIYDVNGLIKSIGIYWPYFLAYNIACAQHPTKKVAAKGIMSAMSGKIPESELAKIDKPVTLIWGRHDKANNLKVALKASKKYGWPLRIIEDTRDDPKLEKPVEFVQVVESMMAQTT
ncbi:alpha/beta fold hydrolase [Arenibacter algicola]|uniref:alpha/beta fold hydrolase n=1 Tax=Arenibacter algicola TaxID=616991 RepID=UPI0004DFB61F|nr:alpha/beta hydrolase [Arenibacter algicola]